MAIGLSLVNLGSLSVAAADSLGNPFEPDERPGLALTGRFVNGPDSDGDGITDFRDADSHPGSSTGGTARGTRRGTTTGSHTDDTRRHPDRDADGVRNQEDLDDDNDTILDTQEEIIDADGNGVPDRGSRDSDGDEIPDGYDLDSDNDGILDLIEARWDAATIASLDPVSIGSVDLRKPVGSNGIPDDIESSADSGVLSQELFDTDSDGLPDYLDIDSDGDGIYDLVEAGGVDTDGDGRIDGFVDKDKKGVDDAVQASALPRFDTDGDGKPDYMDTDSDNDGILDTVENTGSASMPTDTDNDGAADYREKDSDNDGVPDAIEVGPDVANPVDSNGDGTADFQDASVLFDDGTSPGNPGTPGTNDDHDADGQPDGLDTDDDNDGIPDLSEGSGDSDSDGVINRLDGDSDNDGILDSRETGIDSDADGIPDFLDLDSDNDGLFDAAEAGRTPLAANGTLASAASVDQFGLARGASASVLDTDADGVADLIDLDSDNDGLLDVQETGLDDIDLDGRLDGFTDRNGDGADDSLAGTAVALRDSDDDRIPDVRDLDSDQDGLSDLIENSRSSQDLDNDGRVDDFLDANGDGLDDDAAAHLAFLIDTDGDGLPDSIDLDSDGDGISDLQEAGGTDADRDGRIDLLHDADGDGIPDINDADITGGSDIDHDSIDDSVDVDFVTGPDTDGDGVIDSMDPDQDGNGFVGPFADATAGLSQGNPVNLPDTNGDGIPDVQQSNSPEGQVETGLGGSGFGCSILSFDRSTGTDPVLPLLIGGGVLLLSARIRRRKQYQSDS
jgi:hypothetical protein